QLCGDFGRRPEMADAAILHRDDRIGLVHHCGVESLAKGPLAKGIATEGQDRPAQGRGCGCGRRRQRKTTRASRSSIWGTLDGSSNSISASTEWALPSPRSALLRFTRVTVIGARTTLPL